MNSTLQMLNLQLGCGWQKHPGESLYQNIRLNWSPIEWKTTYRNKQTNKQTKKTKQTNNTLREVQTKSVGLSHKKCWASSPHSALPEPVCSPGSEWVWHAADWGPAARRATRRSATLGAQWTGWTLGLPAGGGGQPPGSTRPWPYACPEGLLYWTATWSWWPPVYTVWVVSMSSVYRPGNL